MARRPNVMVASLANLDWVLLGTLAAILTVGMTVLYAATHTLDPYVGQQYFNRQWLSLAVGLVGAGLAYAVPWRLHYHAAPVYYVAGLVALAALELLVHGRVTRWLMFGGISAQPSEFVKFFTLAMLSRHLADRPRTAGVGHLVLTVLMAAVPALLVLREPDLGTSLVFSALLVALLLWSGVEWIGLVVLLSPLVSLISAIHPLAWGIFFTVMLAFLLYMRVGAKLFAYAFVINLAIGAAVPTIWESLHDYQKDRLLIFVNPSLDPLGRGYQILQSQAAVGSGGVIGRGDLGTQTSMAFLPERHTDFIFGVLGERYGLIGGIVLLALYGVLIWRGYWIASMARNSFASLLACGITTIFAFQTFVNIGMTLGIMPVTGFPLPLVSYGG